MYQNYRLDGVILMIFLTTMLKNRFLSKMMMMKNVVAVVDLYLYYQHLKYQISTIFGNSEIEQSKRNQFFFKRQQQHKNQSKKTGDLLFN